MRNMNIVRITNSWSFIYSNCIYFKCFNGTKLRESEFIKPNTKSQKVYLTSNLSTEAEGMLRIILVSCTVWNDLKPQQGLCSTTLRPLGGWTITCLWWGRLVRSLREGRPQPPPRFPPVHPADGDRETLRTWFTANWETWNPATSWIMMPWFTEHVKWSLHSGQMW